jgi:hypothetical protein
MRRVIRKRVRRRENGVNVAADIDAVVAINTGSGKRQGVSVKSEHRVVQDSRATPASSSETKEPEEKEGP